MWIFDRWSPYSYQNNMEKYKDDDEKRYFNLKECLWFCMTSLTPQVRKTIKIRYDSDLMAILYREAEKLPRICLDDW